MRKVLAVFMSVMMLISTFTGVISVSAAEEKTVTLMKFSLGDAVFTDSTVKGVGTLTATNYINDGFEFHGGTNSNWSNVKSKASSNADCATILATYAQPKYVSSSVDTSTLTAYSNIAAGHSKKLIKHTQTANVSLLRVKNFVNTAALPATGKITISVDVYPTDVTTGTLESTTTQGVQTTKGTLASDYGVRVGDSTGSGEKNMTKTVVKADQWNTITHTVDLATRATMSGIRIDLAASCESLSSYNKAFPATLFFDNVKVEYTGTEITDSGFTDDNTGNDNTGGSAGDDNTGDDNTGDDNTGGETITVWESVLNCDFENSSTAPASAMNIWGKDSSNDNINSLNKFDTYTNAGISKPNTTEDFGSALIRMDATGSSNTKGLYEGRLNDFSGFTFESGAKYKFSIWAYLAKTADDGASDTAKMTIKPYCGKETAKLGSTTATLTKGQWQKIEYEVEISGANEFAIGQTSGFRFAFGATSGTNYPTVIYVDNARVEKLTEKVVTSSTKTKVLIDFESSSVAPATGKNFWGKKPGTTTNTGDLSKYVNWADETSVSKPNSDEDFGAKFLKIDGSDTSVTDKGIYTGRINDIAADVVGFTAGMKYTFSAWILAAKTTTGTAKVELYPYSTNGISTNTFTTGKITLKEGEWQKLSASFIATADHLDKTAGFRFRFAEIDTTNYATLVYMDNLKIVESDPATETVELAVKAEGNGKVEGSGEYANGEKATLTATPDDGYVFAGWYNGSTLLSKENPYEYTVDGTVTSITGKFEKFVPNVGDNWVTIDVADFENATLTGLEASGTTSNGVTYKMAALDGGKTDLVLSADLLSEAEAGIGNSSNKVFKFAKTGGPDGAGGMMRLYNFFSLSDIAVGDIIKVTFKVYPTDLEVVEGKSDKTASFGAFYSVSGKYGSGTAAKTSDSTGARNLELNKWTELGFTTTVTQAMLDAATAGSLRIGPGAGSFAKTLYLDDFKAEVYKDMPAADNIDFVEDFDSVSSQAGKVNSPANVENIPYVGKVITRKDNNTQNTKFNLFGTGCGSNINMATNAEDLSGVLAHSGTNSIVIADRFSANGGMKVDDIFMGKFGKKDIGRRFVVSAWIYPDSTQGVYKLQWDEANQKYAENSKAADAEAYTKEEIAAMETTTVSVSFAGPNDGFYSYRTGNYNSKKFDVKWNEWNYIYLEITISEDILDNGIYDGSVKNPLISAIRIDQQGADGQLDSGIAKVIYVDDMAVKEITYEVSAAIGDHMVYQKGRPIRVWGINGDIGEDVTVKFNGVTKKATTDADGKWVAEFDKIDTYTRNLTIEVTCPGEMDKKFTDVSIGEVILASGQSNMEWNLKKVYEAEDIIADAATNENISILSFENSQTTRGSYTIPSSPKGAYWSKKSVADAEICSGVGYITAYNIAKKYDIPVAVVDANLSGSNIIAWLPQETIEARKDDVYKDIYEEMINKTSSVTSGSIWKRVPAGMFNSLLAPLDNYEIGIMLWYQGCSNSGQPEMYNYYQYDLINAWRDHFGAEDTPFVICQLAPYQGSYMALRQVQLDTAKRMDNVHLVVTADLGPTGSEDKDSKLYSEMTSGNEIHPVRKIPVADRISKTLYANYFGEDIVYSGPEYIKMEVKDDYAILHFKHIGSGIVKIDETKGITGFEIGYKAEGSEEITYIEATAEILSDNTIKVYADGVTNIVEVRYCWVNWVVPEDALTSEGGKKLGNTLGGNLTNETGIPMGPFKATLPVPTIFAATTATDSTGIDISVAVRNIGYSEASPRLIVGLYNGERLVGLKSENIDFKTIDTKTLGFKFYALTSDITDDTTIKAFLWNDMGTMIPLQSVYPIERK